MIIFDHTDVKPEDLRLPAARRERLVALCLRHRFMSVRDLAARTGASIPTIQRDLIELDQQGLLRRVRAGAAAAEAPPVAPPVPWADRQERNPEAKRVIAAETARRIAQAGTEIRTIFLGSGTTVLAAAEALDPAAVKTVRFVTNAYPVARRLADQGLHHLLLPGRFLPSVEAVVGEHALAMLDELRFGLCVLGFEGLDAKRGVTDADSGEALLKARAAAHSRSVVGVADGTKWGASAAARVGPLNLLDELVTDRIGSAATTALRRAGVRVHSVGKAS